MPENIQNGTPSGVMPYALCTAFSEFRECAQLQAQYHDGTTERIDRYLTRHPAILERVPASSASAGSDRNRVCRCTNPHRADEAAHP